MWQLLTSNCKTVIDIKGGGSVPTLQKLEKRGIFSRALFQWREQCWTSMKTSSSFHRLLAPSITEFLAATYISLGIYFLYEAFQNNRFFLLSEDSYGWITHFRLAENKETLNVQTEFHSNYSVKQRVDYAALNKRPGFLKRGSMNSQSSFLSEWILKGRTGW